MGVNLQPGAVLYQSRSQPVDDKSGSNLKNGTARYTAIANHRHNGCHPLGHTERSTTPGSWLAKMPAHKPGMRVATALANKLARPVWALTTSKQTYRIPPLAA